MYWGISRIIHFANKALPCSGLDYTLQMLYNTLKILNFICSKIIPFLPGGAVMLLVYEYIYAWLQDTVDCK